VSLVFNEYRPQVYQLIYMFLRDVDKILSSTTNYEERVAMATKWLYVLNGLGMPMPEFDPDDATPEDLERVMRHALRWIASVFKARRR